MFEMFESRVATIQVGRGSAMRWLANLTLVFALFPYMSPVAISNMDVQPTSLFVSGAVLLTLFLLFPNRMSFHRKDLLLLVLGLLAVFYVNYNRVNVDFEWIRSCAPMLLGFPTYLAVRLLYPHMSPKILLWVVCFYAGALAFQILSPNSFASTFGHFLSDMRWSPEEGRGPNGLCPEPSMLADISVLFAIALYFFHPEYWRDHRGQASVIVILAAFMVIASKSGTGVVLALVIGGTALLGSQMTRRARTIVIVSFLCCVLLAGSVASHNDQESRSAKLFVAMADNPTLVLQDASLAARVLGVFVGIYELPKAPFGNGSISVNSESTTDAINSKMGKFLWPSEYVRDYLTELILTRDRNTGIGNMVQRMGILGIFILSLLLTVPRDFRGYWVVRVYVAAFLLNSTLFVSSLWFIVGCCVALNINEFHRKGSQLALMRN